MAVYLAEVFGLDGLGDMLGITDTHQLAQQMIDDFLDVQDNYGNWEWDITEIEDR